VAIAAPLKMVDAAAAPYMKAATDILTPGSTCAEERVHVPTRMPRGQETFRDQTAATAAVEIKVTIRAEQEMKAIRLFGLDRANAESREIYFFDTPQLDCFRKHAVLRARMVKNGPDDSTVKIRPVDPERIAPRWKALEGFKLEADVAGTKVVRSASLTLPQKRGEIKEAAAGERALKKLFSPDQERFLEGHALSRVPFDSLRVLGPVAVLRWKFGQVALPGELTAEEWHLPDGTDLLEFSIKVDHEDAVRSRNEFVAFLARVGLDHTGVQEAKTRIALEFFARRLAGV
jgi:hypothetical protein